MLWDFLLVIALIELSPGPNMLVLAAIAARDGRAAGIAAVAGVTLGLSAYLLLAATGLGVALAQAPGLLALLRWAGIGYLVWLAWEAFAPNKDNAPAAITPPPSHARHFQRGLLANLLNAKAAIFYTAILPRFIEAEGPPAWLQALGLGALHLAIATSIHLAIVLGADTLTGPLKHAVNALWVRSLFALSLLASALWLAVSA